MTKSRRRSPGSTKHLLTAVALACGAFIVSSAALAGTATVTVSNQQVGTTLQYVGYNQGHYMPGSNTSAWVEYSGVNAFRVWATSSDYEVQHSGEAYRDDFGPWGDGVSSLSTFNARKDALRADPLNQSFIDWEEFNGYFQNKTQTGRNKVRLNHILGELDRQDIHVLQQTTRSAGAFPITGESDWAGKWEQWQHYYAMAFHSARNYNVSQFQMYNEPNLDSNTNMTDWNIRLKLASDAVRSAVADVNRLYGKSLVADIGAPVSAGGASRVDDWGASALRDIRTDYQGQTVGYDIFNSYSAQVYGETGSGFASQVRGIRQRIPLYHAGGTAAGQAMPIIFTEFNRYTSSSFDSRTETLDTPAVFTDIASIYVGAQAEGTKAMYAFKFSQTMWDPPSDGLTVEKPQKTGFHYVQDSGTYDTTGATRAAGVVRLFAKGFTDERARLDTSSSTTLGTYDMATSFDDASKNYYVFGVNRSSTENHSLTFDLTSWNIPVGTVVTVEEVSSLHHGEVTRAVLVPASRRITLLQPKQSVWLLTVPSIPHGRVTLGVTADARVRNSDAASAEPYSSTNYGTLTRARIGRTPDSARFDYATYLKFNVGNRQADGISRAILHLHGISMSDSGGNPGPILFHVYALSNDTWSEQSITWNNAPNLIGAADAKLTGVGTTAFPVGHLTFTGGTYQQWGVDITQFLRDHPDIFNDGQMSFALVREERFTADADPALSFVEIYTKEAGNGLGPKLTLFLPEPGSGALLALTGAALLTRRRTEKTMST